MRFKTAARRTPASATRCSMIVMATLDSGPVISASPSTCGYVTRFAMMKLSFAQST
jgi:hypothetical protein